MARGSNYTTTWGTTLASTPPYGPWVELFGQYPQGGALPAVPAAFAQHGTVGAVESQSALIQQVRDFFAALTAVHPLVLLLEDLHWVDPASLDVLRPLARTLTTLPLLVIATYRSDELARGHPLALLLPLRVREAGAERIALQALDDVAVWTLITARYALRQAESERLVAYLHARAEGNALFVGELLRALEEAGTLACDGQRWRLGGLTDTGVPTLLRQVIDARVARLDAEAQRLLVVAAVIGQEVLLDVWAAAAAVSEEAVLAAVEQAVQAGVIREMPTGAGVQFTHALIREAVYEGERATRRRRLHRVVGEALMALPQPDPDAVAYHFQQAGDERAVEWLVKAGERAQSAFAWVMAVQRFEEALSIMGRADIDADTRGWLALRLSRLLRWIDVGKSQTYAEEAVALADRTGDRALASYARLQLGEQACNAGDVASGLAAIEAGAAMITALSDPDRLTLSTHAAAVAALSRVPDGLGLVVPWRAYVGRFGAARELGESRIAAATDGDEAIAEELRGCAVAYAALGMADEAERLYERAYAAYQHGGHHAHTFTVAWHRVESVTLPYRTEDIQGRRQLAQRTEEEFAKSRGAVPDTFPPRFARLPVLVLDGEWDEAERLATMGSGEERGTQRRRANALRYLAMLARMRGEAERAWQAVQMVLPTGPATEPGTKMFDTATALQREAVILSLGANDLAKARAWLDAYDRWLVWSGAVLGKSEGQALWAQYYRQAGDHALAQEHAEAALAHATEPRQPLALLAAHRLLGELKTAVGQHTDATRHFDAARTLADACQAPYERALTLLARAELEVARGETAQAQVLLNDARAVFQCLGAAPALARADALGARIALSSPPTVPRYPAGLSVREVDVLRLVAQGLTTPQVADRLSLSPRTVEQHLRSIYNRLGVSTRTAAVAFAVGQGLT